jgi:hypothetical protein
MSITSPVALTNIQALPKGRHSKTNRIKKKKKKKHIERKKSMTSSKFKIHDSILIHIHFSPSNLQWPPLEEHLVTHLRKVQLLFSFAAWSFSSFAALLLSKNWGSRSFRFMSTGPRKI